MRRAPYLTKLLTQFSRSTELESLDITCCNHLWSFIVPSQNPHDPSLPEILGPGEGTDELRVPRLRSFRICCPATMLLDCRDGFTQAFTSRAQTTPEPLQLTVIQSSFTYGIREDYGVLHFQLDAAQSS